jgi:hypothetical protein
MRAGDATHSPTFTKYEASGDEQLYRSPNGDTWFLARDPATGLTFVRHQANAASGGQVTDIEIATFLSGSPHPQQQVLLRVVGASIVDPQGTAVEDEPLDTDTEREWSDAERSWETCSCAARR